MSFLTPHTRQSLVYRSRSCCQLKFMRLINQPDTTVWAPTASFLHLLLVTAAHTTVKPCVGSCVSRQTLPYHRPPWGWPTACRFPRPLTQQHTQS